MGDGNGRDEWMVGASHVCEVRRWDSVIKLLAD
jgi:hypothetical protein